MSAPPSSSLAARAFRALRALDWRKLQWRKRRALHFFLLAFATTGTACALSQAQWRWAHFLDNLTLDAAFRLRGEKEPSVVATTLPQTSKFLMVELQHPLPRPVLGALIEKLRLARVVAVDLMLPDHEAALSASEKQLPQYRTEIARWRRENALLAAQIKRSGNVVLGAWPERVRDEKAAQQGVLQTRLGWLRPPRAVWDAARWHGHVRIEPDVQDGVVRRVRLFENISGLKSTPEFVPSLGLAVAAASEKLSPPEIEAMRVRSQSVRSQSVRSQSVRSQSVRSQSVRSQSAGAADTGKHFDFAGNSIALESNGEMIVDYLGGRRCFEYDGNRVMAEVALGYDAEDFRDHIVFIGQTDMGAKDMFPTAFGDIPGVHIHAAIAATLRSAAGAPSTLGIWPLASLALIASLCLGLPLLRLPLWSCSVLMLVEIGAVFVLAAWSFVRHHTILPPSVPIIAIALTYNGIALYEYGRTRATLGRFIGRDLLREILHPTLVLRLGGRVENATAFFCDLHNYSTQAEYLAPQQVAEILNAYTTTLVAAVKPFGGRPLDYLGDGVLILFQGTQESQRGASGGSLNKNHTARAVQAAIAAQRAFAKTPHHFAASIAIHCGDMLIGMVGAEDNLKPGAVGDAVNVTARAQAFSQECGYDILLTRDAAERVSDTIEVHRCGEFPVKGRRQIIELFGVNWESFESSPGSALDIQPIFHSPIRREPDFAQASFINTPEKSGFPTHDLEE